MRVVLAVDALVPPLTGIGRYAFELASRIAQVDTVDELRFFDAGHWVLDSATLLQHAQLLEPPPATIATRPIQRKRKWPRWVRRHIGPAYWRHVLKGRVFHGPNYFLPQHVDKGVITVHDLSVFLYPQMHPAARIEQFALHFERSLKTATHIITDSEAIRRDVMTSYAWSADRITAVPLGVAERFRPQDREETGSALRRLGLVHGSYVLCVSTLEPRKNIDKLLMAYERIPPDLRRSCPLVLLGAPGWENNVLRSSIEHAQAKGWLIHPGFVHEADLPSIYAGARLLAFPSIYEGFGLPLLEAMACGTPVLTSNQSSLAEVAGDAALLVDPEDVESFARHLERGLLDEAWRAWARERGLARAAAYSWQRCAEATVAVYRRVDAL